MPGLIDINATPKTKTLWDGTNIGEASATGYDPSQVTIDPSKQTVSGQLKTILGQGSPYMDRARAGAMETANSRGLINSTMAAQAGESAGIDAALPIASADSNVYNTAALTNAAANNRAFEFGAGAGNTAGLANAGAISEIGRIGASGTQQRETQAAGATQAQEQARLTAGLETELQKGTIAATGEQQRKTLAQSGAQDVAIQKLKGEQAISLANIEAQYKQLIQASAAASDSFKIGTTAITQAIIDPNSTADQKQAAVNTISGIMQASLAVAGAITNLDLSELLNFGAIA